MGKVYDPVRQVDSVQRLTQSEAATYSYVQQVLPKMCAAFGNYLHAPRRAGDTSRPLDVAGAMFLNCDWSDADVGRASIAGGFFRRITLEHADLGANA